MPSSLLALFLFGVVARAGTLCSPLFVTPPGRPALALNELIRLVADLSMPSAAISVLAADPGDEALALMRRRELSTLERRRLTELAVLRVADPGDDAEAFTHLLHATIPDAPTADSDLMRSLFRIRPPVDLREVSPALRTVADRTRFFDTFSNTMTTLFDRAAREWPKSLRSLDHWTAIVETILRRDFSTAPGEVKLFIAHALDRRFLKLPAPPSAEIVLAQYKAALATRTDLLPGRSVDELVIDVPLRERATSIAPVDSQQSVASRVRLRSIEVHPHGIREVDELPDYLRGKLDEFLVVARDPSRHLEMMTARGRWNIKALCQFGPDAHEARLSRGYRVLFDLHPDLVLVRRVNKGQIHGN